MKDRVDQDTARYVEQWHGITLPDAANLEFLEDVAKLVEAFRRVNDAADFEREPADFLKILARCKEGGQP